MEIEQSEAQNQIVMPQMSLTRKTLTVVGTTIIVLLLLAVLWFGIDILFLAFAGALMAIFLNGLAHYVSQWLKLKRGYSLAIVTVLLVVLIVGGGFTLAPGIAEQSKELSQQLPKSIDNLREYIGNYEWGKQLIDSAPKFTEIFNDPARLLPRIGGVVSSTVAALMNFLIVLAMGIYFAVEPSLYRRGFIRLFPIPERQRMHEVIDATGNTLWWWIIGVLISMTTIGVLTTIGLWILGIPLAPTLGLLTGILAFIPNFGPILSAIPPVLLGLMHSPLDAVYVVILYLIVQAIESNIVTPQVQRRTVSMPPVLGMVGQLLFGVFFGFLGLLLATPIVAASLVLVKMLYVEDVLGDKAGTDKRDVTPSSQGSSTERLVGEGPN